MADTLARASAQIIPMPGACAEPVVQRRGPGRHPRNIVSLRRARVSREHRQLADMPLPPHPNSVQAIQGELDSVVTSIGVMQNGIQFLTVQKRVLESRLAHMQYPNGRVLAFATNTH